MLASLKIHLSIIELFHSDNFYVEKDAFTLMAITLDMNESL